MKELSRSRYLIFPDLVRDAFILLRKHLKEKVPDDALEEIEVPPVPQPKGAPEITLDMQIASLRLEFSTAKLWMERLLSGDVDEAEMGYYILKLTRDFSRAFELFFALGKGESMRKTWEAIERLKKLSREHPLSLTMDPAVYRPLQKAEVLHELWSFMEKSMPVPSETLSRVLAVLYDRTPLQREALFRIKEYLESHGYEAPKELIETLDNSPSQKKSTTGKNTRKH